MAAFVAAKYLVTVCFLIFTVVNTEIINEDDDIPVAKIEIFEEEISEISSDHNDKLHTLEDEQRILQAKNAMEQDLSDKLDFVYRDEMTLDLEALVSGGGQDDESHQRNSPSLTIIPTGANKNTTANGSSNDTSNATDVGARKIVCVAKNVSEDYQASVKLVNSTELLQKLSLRNDTQSNCAVVLFYAPWCNFCALTAPHYNALARAYPSLEVLAIDAVHFSSLNARFGTIAVPNILVFHNTKAVARFNSSEKTLERMIDFVSNITGMEPNRSVSLSVIDYQGPVPTIPSDEQDYLLWAAWIFLIIFATVMTARSEKGQQVLNLIMSFGHEHQHID